MTAWFLLAASAAGGPGSDQGELRRFSFSSFRMGTQFNLILYAPSERSATRASRLVFDRIAELERVLSDYREDSELRTVERTAFPAPVAVSPDLMTVLARAVGFARLTGGAFDPTVGAWTRLWREAASAGAPPSPRRLEQALDRIGHDFLLLDEKASTVGFKRPGIQLDLGGIAKGYAADQGLAVLAREGLPSALIDAGGDIATGRAPPGKAGWTIDVEPLAAGDPGGRFTLQNQAVATSGTSQRRFLGQSHLYDPSAAGPLRGDLLSTVIAPDATTADALATAFSVMAPSQAMALAERLPGICARLVREDQTTTSACFPQGPQTVR